MLLTAGNSTGVGKVLSIRQMVLEVASDKLCVWRIGDVSIRSLHDTQAKPNWLTTPT